MQIWTELFIDEIGTQTDFNVDSGLAERLKTLATNLCIGIGDCAYDS